MPIKCIFNDYKWCCKKYDMPVIFLRQDCAILAEFAIITGQYIKKLSKLSVNSQLLYVQ